MNTTEIAQGHQVARAKMIEYFELQGKKAELDTRMKALKEDLRQFAFENEEHFENGQYTFDCCGYLRIGSRTKVKVTRAFSLLAFIKAGFGDFIKKEFYVSAMKVAFQDNYKQRDKARKLGVTLTTEPEFEIIRAGEQITNNEQH